MKQALGHENTDLFGFNGVVIIEGDTEDVALPILAESLGIDLPQLGAKLLNIRGSGKTARIEELLKFLKDSDTIPFLMLDGHPNVQRRVDDWIRQSWVRKENVFIWEKEFEDCFDNAIILKAVKDWTLEEEITIRLSEEELSEARKTGKKISDFLDKKAFEQTGRSVDKPALAEKIALIAAADKERTELTKPEEALKEIKEALLKI